MPPLTEAVCGLPQTEDCLGPDYATICFRDLPDDGIDNVVMAFDLPIEGPNAPGPGEHILAPR